MNKQYDNIVYIGRFQPFHNAHLEIIKRASTLASNVIIIIGSKSTARSPKNPFSFQERREMITESLICSGIYNFTIFGINDYTYNDSLWLKELCSVIPNTGKTAIIGHNKDSSSYYLKLFPQYTYLNFDAYPSTSQVIDATKIRAVFYTGDTEFLYSFIKNVVPEYVFNFLVHKFKKTEAYNFVVAENNFYKDYKLQFANLQYPPIFVTVDGIVIQSGHILLIKRKFAPGKDLYAMPGGFINSDERLEESLIRELREETKIKVPEKVLKGSIVHAKVFDDPARSLRGRTITHAYLIHLEDSESLPHIRGSDDASKAEWFPISDFYKLESQMFEDHFHIITNMINYLN